MLGQQYLSKQGHYFLTLTSVNGEQIGYHLVPSAYPAVCGIQREIIKKWLALITITLVIN